MEDDMKKFGKKITVAALGGAMTLGLLGGCSKTDENGFDVNKTVISSDEAAAKEVFDVDGDITYMDEVYMYTLQCMYMYGATEDAYTSDSEYYKDLILDQMAQMKGEYVEAIAEGIQLDEEDEANIESYVDNYYNTFSEEVLERYGISRDTVTKIFTQQVYGSTLEQTLSNQKNEEYTDIYTDMYGDTRFFTFYYLLFPYYELDDDGEPVEGDGDGVLLSDEEIAVRKENALEAIDRIKAGEDPEEVAASYNVQNVSQEQSGYDGAFSDTLNEVLAGLEQGEVSDIIESNTGYIVVYMSSTEEDELRDNFISAMASSDASEALENSQADWKAAYTIDEDNYVDYAWYDVDFEDVCKCLDYYNLHLDTTDTE
jgi:foldase protein PrsA